ncbi:amidohydrolase family protein [Paenibacillus sp. BSR1-1]|uniref:amidohydrolase family protein n=1 Tax=Paenibacillus sp. BSR1-1 TaxID=3020845 RepID=UPI0025B038A0|nr:amidohydrolase family protein [Paenibacillus sp. BSR1-1]MDN3019578.1 amidohydrolase family protein [Paenibacillus sp. BSR1-1]
MPEACLKDGTLAGSILTMKESIRNTMRFTGCTLRDMVFMASVNPAKQLNFFHRKGSLEVGKDADIVVLDETMDVLMTFCKGIIAFSSNITK